MLDFSKTAFVFPGQGSQSVGMGKDIADAYPIANQTFQQADDLMGMSLSKIMFEGSDDDLGDTAITQPAMYVHSVALLRVLQQEMPSAQPACVAGHSLGEFTALTSANSLSYEDGVKLVQTRGQLMKQAGEESPGGMAAILALDVDVVREIVTKAADKTSGVVVIANDNCPGQIVISGDKETLDVAVELAKEAGARRAIPLDVSVATHSPLMNPAKEKFVQALANTEILPATMPVYQNVCACPVTTVEQLQNNLELQIISSVRWTETIQAMIDSGVETFIELGSKNVLTGLLKRINRAKMGINIQDLPTLHKFLEEYA